MPADDFSLIGIGSRTDEEGAYQAMISGEIYSDEIFVVENPTYDFAKINRMVNMHLDTYFNIAGNGIAITSTYLAKMAKGTIPEQLAYSSNFITLGDKKIIAVNVKKVIERLLSEHAFYKKTENVVISELSKIGSNVFPDRADVKREGIDFINADLIELTGGYGGAHCMTAMLEKE